MFPFSRVLFAFIVISTVFGTEIDKVDFCNRESEFGCARAASSDKIVAQQYRSPYLKTLQMQSSPIQAQNDLIPCYFCNSLSNATRNLIFTSSSEIFSVVCEGFLEIPIPFQSMCKDVIRRVADKMNSMVGGVPMCGAIGMCLLEGTTSPQEDLLPCKFCKDMVFASRNLALHTTTEILKVICEPMWNIPPFMKFKDMCRGVIQAIIDKVNSMVGDIPFCSDVRICLPDGIGGTSFAAGDIQYVAIDKEGDSNSIHDQDQSNMHFSNEFFLFSAFNKFDLSPFYNFTSEWADNLYDEFITEECSKRITHPTEKTEITSKLKSGQFFDKICKRGTLTLAKVLANEEYKRNISRTVREICLNSQIFQEECQLLGDNNFELVFKFLSDSLNSTKICDEMNFGAGKSWKEYLGLVEPFFKYMS